MEGRISRWGQIRIYTGKCFRLFLNEKQWKNLISTAVIMILVSLVTSEEVFRDFEDTTTGVFAVICGCIWIGLFNSVQSICKERAIIKREYRTGLHISSYILAHVLYELALSAAEALIVTIIVCAKNYSHLPDTGLIFPMVIDFYISILLTIFAADMIAILISCIVKTENTAMTVMPFVLIIQLVMAGTIFPLSGITELISYLTISKWGSNAVCSIANTNTTLNLSYRYLGNGECDSTAGNLASIWLRLLIFAAVYILISIIALKQVDKDKR